MPDLSSLKRTHGRTSRMVATLATASAVGAAALAAIPATASASKHQIAIIQDSSDLSAAPAAASTAMAQFRALGATTVRVIVPWATIAPNPKKIAEPKHFKATDPAAYRAAVWAPYDNIDRAAKTYGLTVDFVVSGGAPRWAEGPGIPHNYVGNLFFAWKPNAADYGQFFKAVATRYDGKYKPKGQSSPLPAIHFWSIYNEPNFGENLGPQAIHGSSVSYAPQMYRSLLNAGWKALHSAPNHARDTVLIGGFAAMGFRPDRAVPRQPAGPPRQRRPDTAAAVRPHLYCLNHESGRKLSGNAAKSVHCPSTAKAKSRFRASNPALFKASGVADHPYPTTATPRREAARTTRRSRTWATSRAPPTAAPARGAAGASTRSTTTSSAGSPIRPTTTPSAGTSPRRAAYYINWAEYLSWRNPLIASYDQYLLRDPPGHYPFSSGLETSRGKRKPTYNAFRMPLYMPKTTFSHTQAVTVWGEARPARFGKGPQSVAIQFQAARKGSWKTVQTVRSSTYFSVRQRFARSGNVRIAYRYPKSDQLLPPGLPGHLIVGRSRRSQCTEPR